MKNIETTADRIKIFENTIRLSADFLIVSANAIRKPTDRYGRILRKKDKKSGKNAPIHLFPPAFHPFLLSTAEHNR